MFTGLIEEIGVVKSIVKGSESAQITIDCKKVLEAVKEGDSISTNGVCLTVTKFNNHSFTVDVMPETMRSSNLGNLLSGSIVNLERALKLSDRLGGHIVSGHIDGVGTIKEFQEEDNATWITIKASKNILKYVIHKGSIAIDGTSLTIACVSDEEFKISIIPLTKTETNLLTKRVGDQVNIECDIIGKYVERLNAIKINGTDEKIIDMNFLSEHGFA